MPRPDNSTPLIDPLSANDSQNNPSFNSIILKTISGSIYQSRVGPYSTPTPFDIIECSNYWHIGSAGGKGAAAETHKFCVQIHIKLVFNKSTQIAVNPAILFGWIWGLSI